MLVFPPTLFMWGAQLKPEMVLRHFSEIAAGADLPIVVFEYPPASGIGYAPETLARLAEISQVVAVKDWSNEIVAFEANLRALRATGRSGGDALVVHDVADGDLPARRRRRDLRNGQRDRRSPGRAVRGVRQGRSGRRAADQRPSGPLVPVFYAPPFVDMHNRMKEALVLLGRIPAAYVRPPLTPVSGAEREAIRKALAASGLIERRQAP